MDLSAVVCVEGIGVRGSAWERVQRVFERACGESGYVTWLAGWEVQGRMAHHGCGSEWGRKLERW